MRKLTDSVLKSLIQKETQIFIVSDNYDLDNKELQIPQGTIIRFNGGSISNGTLILNYTKIENLTQGSINAVLSGSLGNNYIYI